MKNRKPTTRGGVWPKGVEQASLTSGAARNVGTSLPPSLRQEMEGRLGADLSDVRVHTNSAVVTDVSAQAFTVGSDIYFAAGRYNPDSGAGRKLLSHELTHVVQQRDRSQ